MVSYETLCGEEVKAFGDYNECKKYAEENNLKLAEYGDVYGSKLSYCYFNKSGDRNDTEEAIAYYTFGEDGKPQPIDDDALRDYLFN